jgi:hypothetical protein
MAPDTVTSRLLAVVTVPPEIVNEARFAVALLTLTVPLAIVTVSPAAGSPVGLQLASLFQLPLLPFQALSTADADRCQPPIATATATATSHLRGALIRSGVELSKAYLETDQGADGVGSVILSM